MDNLKLIDNKHLRSKQGQSMVEFALSIPFLLLILVSILYFGRYFLIAQVLLHAAQEGARVAASTANLSNDDTRDIIRGFSTTGTELNTNSVIYSALASAHLLSGGTSGSMPAGSKVEILPWDSDGTAGDTIPAGTVGVRIDYPFSPFTGSGPVQSVSVAMSFPGNGTPVAFKNFTITERAVAGQEIYQP